MIVYELDMTFKHVKVDFYKLSVFSTVLVLTEKIYQTPKTTFDHISKHVKVRQKYITLFLK